MHNDHPEPPLLILLLRGRVPTAGDVDLHGMLTGMGHMVVEAGDSRSALGLLAAAPFDLVASDMPVAQLLAGGLPVVLRHDRPDLPLLVAAPDRLPQDGGVARSQMGAPVMLLRHPLTVEATAAALGALRPQVAPLAA